MTEISTTETLRTVNVPRRLFVTGIGTDVGKSYATGWLARELRDAGCNAITQKLIQTGNTEYSEDIDVHRKVMGIPIQTVDKIHLTAPIILSYPCSPDLAQKIDKTDVDFRRADTATDELLKNFDTVLIEGAGGIMAPLRGEWLQLDYISERKLPAVVVINGQLGSINHALLTLFAIKKSDIRLWAVIYNPYFDKDKLICDDTRHFIRNWLANHFPATLYFEMPERL